MKIRKLTEEQAVKAFSQGKILTDGEFKYKLIDGWIKSSATGKFVKRPIKPLDVLLRKGLYVYLGATK